MYLIRYSTCIILARAFRNLVNRDLVDDDTWCSTLVLATGSAVEGGEVGGSGGGPGTPLLAAPGKEEESEEATAASPLTKKLALAVGLPSLPSERTGHTFTLIFAPMSDSRIVYARGSDASNTAPLCKDFLLL